MKGDSVRRQTAGAQAWCERNNVVLDNSRTYHDLGKSAFLGEHRSNPDRHALAAFLQMVDEGKIPRGTYLIIESLDRLTREHVTAGLMLCLRLIEEKGIRIVQLSPIEKVYEGRPDPMDLMMMIMELQRGHGESKRKSDLLGPVWRKKKAAACQGIIVTRNLPAWVQIKNGKLVLIPARAKVVRQIFHLAANGYGLPRTVGKLTADGVPAFGSSGGWERAYIGKILRDRRALGEYQPYKGKKRQRDGEVVKDYFPAVVSEKEFQAARLGARERGQLHGRLGKDYINVFAGLLKNVREGDSYYMVLRIDSGKRYHVLANRNADHGLSPCCSFPYLIFEHAILSMLAEVDPKEVGVQVPLDEVTLLSRELANVEVRIRQYDAELAAGGYIPTLAKHLRAEEERKAELAKQLEEAKIKVARPVTEAWKDARSLIGMLANAADPDDVRLRLRSALRRSIKTMHLMVRSRKKERLATVKVTFHESGVERVYEILYRPPASNGHASRPGRIWAFSMVFKEGEVDPFARQEPTFDADVAVVIKKYCESRSAKCVFEIPETPVEEKRKEKRKH
jgi:DNA invertase Pin-like site-specific DNA recombinase